MEFKSVNSRYNVGDIFTHRFWKMPHPLRPITIIEEKLIVTKISIEYDPNFSKSPFIQYTMKGYPKGGTSQGSCIYVRESELEKSLSSTDVLSWELIKSK